MKINLFSPKNGDTVSLIPSRQNELLAALPTHLGEIRNTLDWANPTATQSDNSLPQHVIFTFGYEGSMAEVYGVDMLLDTSADFAEPLKFEASPFQTFITVPNLLRSRKYFWKMVAYGESDIIAESETYSFTTAADLPQWYFLEGSTNIRDIGGRITEDGKEIKSGMLIRGAQTDRDCAITRSAASFMQRGLKIKSVMDLRLTTEKYEKGKAPYGERFFHIPCTAYGEIFEEACFESIKNIFSVLADADNYPIYMHCHAGCDRTGTICFLLEALLGLSPKDIANDYELSSISVFGTRSRYSPDFVDILENLEKYGADLKTATENYLMICGITKEQIENIKKILIK